MKNALARALVLGVHLLAANAAVAGLFGEAAQQTAERGDATVLKGFGVGLGQRVVVEIKPY